MLRLMPVHLRTRRVGSTKNRNKEFNEESKTESKKKEKEAGRQKEAYSHSSWAQKQNAMTERAGEKNHREDEPIRPMQIGSSSRFIVDH